MFTFIKMSTPGWEESVSSLWRLEERLKEELCKDCLSPNTDYGLPDNFDSLDIEDRIAAMLSTSCGCEYTYEED